MACARFGEILRELAANDVEAVVVGLLAGVLRGAPLTTRDVDLVHHRTPENVARLLEVLRRLHATYRDERRQLTPGESHLLGPGHQLLDTDLGELDCLGSIQDGLTYADLLESSTWMELGDGLRIRVLTLEKLIEFKRRAARPKDLAVIPVLEATLDELSKQR